MPSQSNPGAVAAMVTGAAVVLVPAIIASPVLGFLGFGAAGVPAGTAAAGIQSGIGSVAAGSLFATLQSVGAGGYGVAAVHGVVQAAEAVVGAGGLVTWFRGQDDGEDDADEDDQNDDKKKESEKDNSTKDEESESTK
ncbi:uncharacterized protein FIESC28_06416 [Fusarium coffeatum]|uniref:Interferon-induced 6-16 n=1 Tax=Fusarium coffeatum TaxID=231269 RepID=A0A366RMZ4_9HYPO|nr:uncharacterized protein FIESC28_06416 [Fusarium coffeatum]RBR17720.1 hypothetical protein FIESC28_06416 [Fusarium coffeatum]